MVAPKEAIIEAVNDVLRTYSGKLSLRQIYYRLVSKHVIVNHLNAYKRLSKILVKAREAGLVDWRRIEDRARSTHGSDWGYSRKLDPDQYIKSRLESAISRARFNFPKWRGQSERVEVWIEKDALSRIASDVAGEYGVTVCPSKGYSSFTYLKEAVGRLQRYDEPVTILYFGDYDPSGLDITRDLRDRLNKYGARVTVERHCLSLEQIIEHDLPPFPAKKSDGRYRAFVEETGSSDAVELDALEPPILAQYIRDAIEEHIDFDEWSRNEAEGEEHEAELQEAVDTLKEAVLEAFPGLRGDLS